MIVTLIQRRFCRPTLLVVALLCLAACRSPKPDASQALARTPMTTRHLSTQVIDAYDREMLAGLAQQADPAARDTARRTYYRMRWAAVRNAVAHHGTTHRDSFYGSRSYWHTDSTRGLGWAVDHAGDLADPLFVDGRGNVLIAGDVNADIEVADSAIVHVLGDVNANIKLKGVCELIVAGQVAPDATITCVGQLELFIAGQHAGQLAITQGATVIIDDNASGAIQCGAPATTLTVTGNLAAVPAAPADQDALLTLRVDGYISTETMLDITDAGFTRVNGTLGISDAPPGLYPQAQSATRPVARWVVLRQSQPAD